MDKVVEFYKGKKVFITGSTGFKGSWLTRVLLLAGATVKGYGLTPTDKLNLFDILNNAKNSETAIADIRDLDKLKKEIAIFRPDIVIHMAAQPLVRESYKNPVDTYNINVLGTVNLLEACRDLPSIKSILNVTTDKVYLNTEKTDGYTEDEFLCGFDPYSNSKSCSELVTYSYKNSFFHRKDSPPISTARSGNVIGGGDFSADRIIPDCVKAAENGTDIIVRNPDSTRPYQHVLDCLCGYLTLCKMQYESKTIADSYNFGPNDESCVNTGKLVDLFCKYWPIVNWVVKSDNGPHEANFLKLDCSKSKEVLNWSPSLNIDQAVELAVEWYKNYKTQNIMQITDKQIMNFFRVDI